MNKMFKNIIGGCCITFSSFGGQIKEVLGTDDLYQELVNTISSEITFEGKKEDIAGIFYKAKNATYHERRTITTYIDKSYTLEDLEKYLYLKFQDVDFAHDVNPQLLFICKNCEAPCRLSCSCKLKKQKSCVKCQKETYLLCETCKKCPACCPCKDKCCLCKKAHPSSCHYYYCQMCNTNIKLNERCECCLLCLGCLKKLDRITWRLEQGKCAKCASYQMEECKSCGYSHYPICTKCSCCEMCHQ